MMNDDSNRVVKVIMLTIDDRYERIRMTNKNERMISLCKNDR